MCERWNFPKNNQDHWVFKFWFDALSQLIIIHSDECDIYICSWCRMCACVGGGDGGRWCLRMSPMRKHDDETLEKAANTWWSSFGFILANNSPHKRLVKSTAFILVESVGPNFIVRPKFTSPSYFTNKRNRLHDPNKRKLRHRNLNNACMWRMVATTQCAAFLISLSVGLGISAKIILTSIVRTCPVWFKRDMHYVSFGRMATINAEGESHKNICWELVSSLPGFDAIGRPLMGSIRAIVHCANSN